MEHKQSLKLIKITVLSKALLFPFSLVTTVEDIFKSKIRIDTAINTDLMLLFGSNLKQETYHGGCCEQSDSEGVIQQMW